MKRLLRDAVRGMLGVGFRQFFGGIGCIFVLHRVAEKSNSPRIACNVALEISPSSLEALIQYLLSHGYDIVSMDQVHEILTTGKKSKRFAAFTFDDGYLDNDTLARPIFAKYNLPFTIYIATSLIGNSQALWWYRLEKLLLEKNQVAFAHQGRNHSFDLQTHGQKETAFDAIGALIRSTNPADRKVLLETLFASEAAVPTLVMNWDQVKEIARDKNVTIGAHTVHHYDFNRLTDEELLFEVKESRRVIESTIQRKVDHFSYPFGGTNAVNAREMALTKSCNFKTMVTTRQANLFPAHAQHLECLPRQVVTNNAPVIHRFRGLETGVTTARINNFRRVVTV